MNNKRMVLVAAIPIAAALVILMAYVTYSHYEVLDKGKLLSYTHGFIYEILLFDKYKVYVEPEVRLTGDVINTVILLGIAFISVTFATIIYSPVKQKLPIQFLFFTVLSCGMFYLAADELLGIHETIGHNLQFLAELPFVNHPDDLIIVSYGFFAIIFLFAFRSVIFGSRRPLIYFGAAFLMFGVAAISDMLSIFIEDVAEIAAAILILLGTMSIGLAEIESPNVENDEPTTN